MPALPGLPPDPLCQALADFLARCDAGQPVDRGELISAHAEHGEELRSFFEVADRLEDLGFAQGQTIISTAPGRHDSAPGRNDTEDLDGATLIQPPRAERGAGEPRQRPGDETVDIPIPPEQTHVSATFRFSRDSNKVPRPAQPLVRRIFGDYEILQELAKGGMGVVYKARQRKLNRIVALKMILSGQFANQLEVERFYVEAEAAANLRHPNIVNVHEVGEVDGQHFFSMDFVEGQSLSDMVRRQPLEPKHAARLVKKVAETVAFAHEKGVIHRDLKPSNVLVDASDEPMITDFGLAKRADAEESHLTMTGTIIGTPSYMPPEQARGGDVGPLADLYSTGAILYELLTASPPFSAANPFETIKQVLEVEPVPPRVRNPSIPRDLETICLKCLQKEPDKRYPSASELAAELGRYLNGVPIEARPVGFVEKVARWCKRNPLVAALILIIFVVSVGGFSAITASLIATRAALADARQSFHHTRRAIDELFSLVSENELLNQPGAQGLRKQILMKARDLYREVLAHRGDDRAVRDELALSYFRLGRIMQDIDSPQEALESLETARNMQTELLAEDGANVAVADALGDTLQAIAKSYEKLQQNEQALTVYREAAQVREGLTASAVENEEYSRKLINTYMNMAVIEKKRGDDAATDDEAITFYRQAQQQYLKAQTERQKFLQQSPENENLHLDLAKGFFNLANVASQLRLDNQATEYLRQAVAEFDWLVAKSPENLEHQYLRAVSVGRLGDLLYFLDDRDGALGQYMQAIDPLRTLADRNPDVHKYAAALAGMYSNEGLLYGELAKSPEAIDCYGKALDVLRNLAQVSGEPLHRRDLGKTLRDLASQQLAASLLEEARKNLEESQTVLSALAGEFADVQDYAAQLQWTQEALAALPQDSSSDSSSR